MFPTPPDASADAAHGFEPHRRRLQALAYRMLGETAAAEDAVQDAYLRWHDADRAGIGNPQAWLVAVCTRLCVDRLRTLKRQREAYVGPWLPEPVAADPDDAVELAESLSLAFLLALERLTPSERAALLMHDVFEADYAEVARALGRGEEACRQLVSRARRRVAEGKPRFAARREDAERLARRFSDAVAAGDREALMALFAPEATLVADGGGKVIAALNTIAGADRIARFLVGVRRKQPRGLRIEATRVNGMPGFLAWAGERPYSATALDVREGRIVRVFAIRNPDKLARFAAAAA